MLPEPDAKPLASRDGFASHDGGPVLAASSLGPEVGFLLSAAAASAKSEKYRDGQERPAQAKASHEDPLPMQTFPCGSRQS